MDMFGFEAWLKEVETTWNAIYKIWGKGVETSNENYEFMLIVLEKAIRPYYFFLKENESNANRPAGPAPFGSERIDAGIAQERGWSATAKAESSATPKCERCKKGFTPRVKGAKFCLACWQKDHPR